MNPAVITTLKFLDALLREELGFPVRIVLLTEAEEGKIAVSCNMDDALGNANFAMNGASTLGAIWFDLIAFMQDTRDTPSHNEDTRSQILDALRELRLSPANTNVWADLLFAAVNGATRAGVEPVAVCEALYKRLHS